MRSPAVIPLARARISRYHLAVLVLAMPHPFPRPLLRSEAPPSQHPLDGSDRPIVESLLTVEQPEDSDIVQAARLLIRYENSCLSCDLYPSLLEVLRRWNLGQRELNQRSRAVWASGFRPQPSGSNLEPEVTVGSGADVGS